MLRFSIGNWREIVTGRTYVASALAVNTSSIGFAEIVVVHSRAGRVFVKNIEEFMFEFDKIPERFSHRTAKDVEGN